VLFRPLPVERPAELVNIYGHTATSSTHDTHSYPNYLEYRQQTTTLSALVAYSNFFAHASMDGSSDLVVGELVSENYFTTLGIRPVIGRGFSPDEFATIGTSPVAILSHGMWQTQFGGDRAVPGRQFRMNGRPYTVIGVAPETFGGMVPAVTAQMWIPITMAEVVEPLGNQRTSGRSTGETRFDRRGQHWLWFQGRMKPGVTPAQVRTEFETKQGRASNLEPLKQQLAQMEAMLQQMLRQLPSRTEMPDLIVDVSQTALASGISNELFQPGPEVAREFYAEKPIALRMVGTYHQFGAFVSGVASLPRVVIMTMHDISLKPLETKGGADTGALVLAGTVKTYRYLDEEEVEEAAKTAAPNAGAR